MIRRSSFARVATRVALRPGPVAGPRRPRVLAALAVVLPCLVACDCGHDDPPRGDAGELPMELPVIPGEPSGLLFDLGIEKDSQGDVSLVYATTTSGRRARLFYTPIPSHARVHSGSPTVEYKVNFQAFPLLEDADLEDGSGGTCEEPEPCRVPESDVLAMRVPLLAPSRIRVTSVRWGGQAEPGMNVGTYDHWVVRMRVGDVYVEAGHIGWIGPDLRRRMIAAGAIDPDAFDRSSIPPSTEVLPVGADIVMEAREVVGYPQLPTNCFQRVGRHCLFFNQIEFTYGTYEPAPTFTPLHLSPYRYLDESVRTDLRAWMATSMTTHTNGYDNYPTNEWVARAEADLETQTEAEYLATDTIFGRFGEWYENTDTMHGPCPDPAPYCDEGFFFWRALRDTDAFDPSMYENPDVHVLMIQSEIGPGTRDTWVTGEVVTPDDPDPRSDTIVTRWRERGILTPAESTYQAYRYALVGARLTVVKGAERTTRAAAETESATLQDPSVASCDGVNVVCLYRNFIGGLPGGN